MSASDSAPKQETSDPTPPSLPATNATIPPHVLMQIAQLLAAQNIPIPSVPTSHPIPSEPHLGNDLANKPLNNNDDLAKEPLNNNDEAPGKDLAEEPLNNDDEVSLASLASLDDQVHTKTLVSQWILHPTSAFFRWMIWLDSSHGVKHHGYGISKGSSHAGKNIYIRCDRGGTYTGKLENLAKRNSSTRKSYARADGRSSETIEIKCQDHSDSSPALPSDPETLAVNRTISNALHKIRLEDLAGQTPIAALFTLLKASNWVWEVQTSPTGAIQNSSSHIPTFLTTSSGDLLSVWKSLSHAVDHQIAHVHESIGVNTLKTLTNVPRSFLLLSQKVSKHAILAANDQYKRLEDLNPTETVLKNIEEEPEFDLQEEISKIHLLLSHESASQLPRIFKQFHQIISSTHVAVKVQQPDIKTNPKGRPNSQKKRASNSTKRDPSAHEHAEAQLKKDQNKRAANERAAKSRKKVKWSVGADDEEDKASEYGEEEQEMEERKKTTIKFRLPRKTIAMKKAEEKGNMDEKKGDDILEDSPYFLEIPIVFQKYIRGIFNPEGDGNCGFRCIAKALDHFGEVAEQDGPQPDDRKHLWEASCFPIAQNLRDFSTGKSGAQG
ncbi:hypothetical protein H4Q26_004383 [Puccinia striiformis f. sp. tritici PST-130]|nr:hypothetical protein H4Q26_004383 [Puccinia striiformis f. sp. tritici PST-130]